MRTGLLRKILWLLMVCALLCGAQAMAEEVYQDHAELLRDGYLPQKQPMDIVVLRGETFEEFMLAKIEARETVFSIEAYQLTPDALQMAMTDLLDKHPELFYVSNEWLNLENADGVVTEIEISYLYTDEVTAEKKAAFDASVNAIVDYASQADTTLGKVMMVHDYLCVNYEYDESLAIHSAEEMFRTGKGVCQAYLQCFQAVMNELGIECEPVTSLSMAHGWNAVKVNGSWYHLDATWDDPIGNMPLSARHNNFLLSDAGMRANGHYDWTSAVTASSTTYDSFFWSGVNTAIPVVDDVMYYVDAETAAAERTVKAWDMSAGTTADVHTYLISAVDGSAFYVSGYNPIAAGENNLYYMTIDRVYAMPLEGGVPVLMHTTTGTDYIWASWLTGSQLKVYAAETPGESGKIITLDALDVEPLPFSYADNGDGTATITDYTGTDAEVVIPAQLDGLQVTGIANFVFSGKSFITSVEIPEGIKSIGDAAFDGCSLQAIDLPDTLTRLGSWAFFFNDELTEVHLPASLTEIGRNPFGGSGVTKFTVDEANPAFKTDGKVVYSIDGSVLKFCAADIEGVFAVPEGVTAIEDEAFSAVAGLTEVIMPSTLESIGEYAFSEAFALAKVTLNSDLRKIGRMAFINCTSLEGLELPDEISEIGENAFGADLTPDFTLYVNAGTTTEKTLADAGWEYETIMPVYEYIGLDDGTCIIIGYNGEGGAVSIPETLDGLTVIAVSDNAFGYCEDVTQIHLPASVTGIAGNAFMPYCGVQAFTVDDGNEDYAAVDGVLFDKAMSSILCYPARKADTEYTVPESVTAIGENAFYQNYELETVVLPDGVKTIGACAFEDCPALKEINLPKGITGIGEYAFAGCINLTAYVTENSYAHTWCVENGVDCELKSMSGVCGDYHYVDNGDGTATITQYTGVRSFVEVPFKLDELTVTGIADNAFAYCEYITWIDLPSTVNSIASGAFMPYCSVHGISVGGGNNFYAATEDGVLFDKAMSTVVCYPSRKSGAEYIVPESVTAIGENAFYQNYELETVVLPDGVKTIGACAFEDCPALKEINLPKGITGIGEYAFAGCINLTAYVTENSYAHIWCVENGVDCELSKMDDICGDYHYVDNGDGTATITEYTGVSGSVEVPAELDGLTVTGIADNAFGYCESITQIRLPATVSSIASGAFMPYCGVQAFTVDDGNEAYAAVDGVLFDKAMSTVVCYPSRKADAEYTVPESVTAIGENAFYQNYELEYVVLPEGVKTIGACAFEDCSALKEINLPKGITGIGEYAFAGCINLTAYVTENSYAHIWCVENGVDCELSKMDGICGDYHYVDNGDGTATITEYTGASGSVEVPAELDGLTVTGIADNAFGYCEYITQIRLPATVSSIASGAFMPYCGVQAFTVDDGNEAYAAVDGVLFDKAMSTVVCYPSRKADAEYTVPESVTAIGENAFYQNYELETVVLPEGVKTIGACAFEDCPALKEINLPKGITGIGEYAFAGCINLTALVTEDSYAHIWCVENGIDCRLDVSSDYLYADHGDGTATITEYIGAASDVEVPSKLNGLSVTGIGPGAFRSNSSITSVTLPEGLLSIGNAAFQSCGNLQTIHFPEGLVSIGDLAFNVCNLTEITLPSSLTSIGDSAFLSSGSFTTLTVPATLTDIGPSAFAKCNMTSAVLEEGLTAVTERMFDGCRGLTDVTIPGTVTIIDSYAFNNCIALKRFSIPESVTVIGEGAFQNCASLPMHFVLPEGVESVGSYAFRLCTGLSDFTAPESLTSIGRAAFQECTTLMLVDLGGVTQIPDCLFDGCTNLRMASFTNCLDGITDIGSYAFRNCENLSGVTFDDTLSTIGDGAFQGCKELAVFYLPNKVKSVGSNAFEATADLWCKAATTTAATLRAAGYTYRTEYTYTDHGDGTCTIVGYHGNDRAVNIPSEVCGLTVTGIDSGAFAYCEDVTQIRLPATVSSIASGAFMPYCGVQAFTVDDGNEAYAAVDGVLFDKAMSTVLCYPSRKADAEYTVPESVTAIGENAFYQNYELETVVLPEGVKTIGACAFEDCPALKEINLPKGITGIGEYAFAGCINLTAYVIENSYAHTWCVENGVDYELISMGGVSGNYRYVDNGDGTCTITDYTGTAAKVTIPSKLDDLQVTGIGEEAFANVDEYGYVINNTTLTTVVIPKGVTWIGDNAFALCSALSKVTLPETLVSIGMAAFEGCDLYPLTLPDSIATISGWAFSGNGRLTNVDLPASLSELGALAFGSCWEMDQLTIEESNTVYKAENNVLYTKDGTKLVLYAPGLAGAYEVPEGVTEIETRAFSAAIGLTEVKLPSTLRVIGDSAFHATRKLKSINLPEGLETIGTAAFNGSGIESIQIPDGITEIPANAFLNCRSLKTVSLPSSITSIGKQAFNMCELLEALKLPDHISEIGADAFGWSGTADFPLYVNEGTTTEETLAAAGWDYEAIPIPFEYSTLDDGTCAITGYIGTESKVVIPAQIKGCRVSAIAEKAFFGDSTMVHVTIEEGIQTIGAQAFFHSSIESVSVPSSVTAIGSRAFFAANLAQITIAEANPVYQSINGVVFDKAGTTLLIYPIGSTQEAYSVPDTVAKIGDFAFDGADHLKSIGFSCTSRLEEIGEYAIAYLNIESIVLPPNLCTIQEFAFYQNQEMDAVYFLGRAPEIEAASSFGECGEGTLTLYYCEGKAGWQPGWNGYHTAVFDSPDTAHSEVVIEEACAATCTEPGLTEGKYCSDCGEVFSVQEVIAVKDHEPVRENSIPAVKDEDGLKAIVCCSMCGEVYEEEETVLHSKTLFMPAALKEVQAEAFMGSAMQQITIPDGVTSIGSKAFAECPELIMAVIPDSVEEIADDAFEGSDQVLLLCGSEDSYAAQWGERNEVEVEILK